MYKNFLKFGLLLNLLIIINCCDIGWIKYKKNKCVMIFDTLSNYEESVEFCKSTFDAQLLSISSTKEKKYWTFYLFRYLNTTENIWLEKSDSSTKYLFKKDDEFNLRADQCLAMRSLKESENDISLVGDIISQDCNSFSSTVCEKLLKPKPITIPPVVKVDPNSEFIPNRRVKLSNGNDSDIFTGLYYTLYSKYNNQTFPTEMFGEGKCSLNRIYDFGECESYSRDDGIDVNSFNGKLHLLTQSKKGVPDIFNIRRFSSIKQIVSFSKQGLQTFDCYGDGFKSNICEESFEMYNLNALWKLDSTEMKDFYRIRLNNEISVIGVTDFRNSSLKSIGFALYNDPNIENIINDKTLFRFVLQNVTFKAELHFIEWDKSLNSIISGHKNQKSLIDTAVIYNNSPANLNHEVSSRKSFTETFTTSFGSSTKFLESFSKREDLSTSDTQSTSTTNSFANSISEATSSSLTQSISNTASNTESSSKSWGIAGGVESSFSFFGLINVGTSVRPSYESSSSSSHTNSATKESGQSYGTNKQSEVSKTNSNENSKSTTNQRTTSEDRSEGKEQTKDKSDQQMNTNERTYQISKIVTLPPYSAVKISSYANWVNDMSLPFKITIKFTANSWRRKTDGKGTNEWRTLDAEVVEYLMKVYEFPGKITKKDSDAVYGQISGSMSASVGLESVFSANEIDLNALNL